LIFESIIIHLTDLHRDYGGEINGKSQYLPFDREISIIINGLLVGVLVISLGNLAWVLKTRKIKIA
jgi:hypothetical protein